MKNCKIIQTCITSEIYISTAAIWYPGIMHNPLPYFQYETWCFSISDLQTSFQVIHGCYYKIDFYMLKKSIKVHNHITNNLRRIHGKLKTPKGL